MAAANDGPGGDAEKSEARDAEIAEVGRELFQAIEQNDAGWALGILQDQEVAPGSGLPRGALSFLYRDANGASALHVAAQVSHCDDFELLEALTEQEGANNDPRRIPVDERNFFGRTPLHWAASVGRAANCRQLWKMGADLVAKDDEGRKPTDLSAHLYHYECAALLDELAEQERGTD
jgi:Ankyrin repeats (3 copies)